MQENIILSVDNLSKSFGDLEVFKDLNFSVRENEIVSIIGPSGTGKSTLLRSLNYLDQPDSGTVTINDFSMNYKNPSRKDIHKLRQHSAMVFQDYNLFHNKTVLENVTESLTSVHSVPKKKAIELAQIQLEKVGMLEKQDVYPQSLSGGQQQRVAIARALAIKPEILLFDEPTSALDPSLIGEVLSVIKKVAEDSESTMIIVTHEIGFAADISDRIIFMAEGKIQEQGTPEQIFKNPQNEKTKIFLQYSKY